LNDPAKYKNCSGHIKEINEISNDTGAVLNIDKATAIKYMSNTVMMRVENEYMDEFIIEKEGGTVNWTTPKAKAASVPQHHQGSSGQGGSTTAGRGPGAGPGPGPPGPGPPGPGGPGGPPPPGGG
jgi:hypothetical protein